VGSNHTWVLTHFHADHYMGLGKGFKQGLVICSPITAALVRLKLRVAPERLVVLQLGQEVQVEGEWGPRGRGWRGSARKRGCMYLQEDESEALIQYWGKMVE
jgi:glyoxylase-like metal-dependent hydrolase (beta-lactamase superfamily II)